MSEERRSFIILVMFVMLLLLGVALIFRMDLKKNLIKPKEEMPLQIDFLSVGKADCILIRVDEMVVMIDTGVEESKETVLKFLNDNEIEEIHYLILTHGDADHIGGADAILQNIAVDQVIQSLHVPNTTDYEQYQQVMEEKEIKHMTLEQNFYIAGADFKLSIYTPQESTYERVNDYSLVVKLTYGKFSMLFAGDAEERRIDELISMGVDLSSTLLKIPHHGIEESNSIALIDAVSPAYCVVTCETPKMLGDNMRMSLEEKGVEIFYTCNGTVSVLSDGEEFVIRQ